LRFWLQQEVAMDELPPDARAFLAQAKRVHDPHDPRARERIARRLSAALGLGGTGFEHAQAGSGAGTSALGSWLGGGKVMLATAVLALASGGAWWSLRSKGVPHVATPVAAAALSAPVAEPMPEIAPEVSVLPVNEQTESLPLARGREGPLQARRGSAAHVSARAQKLATPKSNEMLATSLADETSLLARASDQLMQHNTEAATRLLEEHTRRYPKSQLQQEREGFLIMARCLRGLRRGSDEAREFLVRNPASVLVPRLSHLCAL
jgi:hypothetical protein